MHSIDYGSLVISGAHGHFGGSDTVECNNVVAINEGGKMTNQISTREQLSVNEIDQKLQATPTDNRLKKELVAALLNRYLDKGSDPRIDPDIDKIRELISELPNDLAPYARAYISYLDEKDDDAIHWLVKYATRSDETHAPPISAEELRNDFVGPFIGFSKGSWIKLADQFAKVWPDSPAVFTLRGLEKATHENSPGEAIDCYVTALGKDQNYWMAAWLCAQVYFEARNWGAARGYFVKAMDSPEVKNEAEVHFNLAWCSSKLKDNVQEEKYYRSCLEIDPDYPSARNNLGWSLMTQGRYEEALAVFDECIKRKIDGSYPLRNRARALSKLGRLAEAIEAWKNSSPRRRPTKMAGERIATLQRLIEKQKQGEIVTDIEEEDDDDVIEVEASPEISDQAADNKSSNAALTGSQLTRFRIPNEQSLEELVESLIIRGTKMFNRNLRVFTSPDGLYGRQYAISGLGRIDLLTEDLDAGDLVVIELKRDETHDQVVGQISLYLTWVKENLARSGQRVIGIVCVSKASKRLQLAARSIPGLEVFEYDLSFRRI